MYVPKDELVATLSDGRFHSGSDLGSKWGVSRTAISNAIRKLDLPGLDVYKVRGKGYRLSNRLYLLDRTAITECLDDNAKKKILSLEIFNTIASTNSWLLEQGLPTGNGSELLFRVCLSEMQEAGRGSRGKKWVSPFGHNIYLSLSTGLLGGTTALDGLSLVCGLAVLQALQHFGLDKVGLKWPNDVLIDDRKVAGVLVEVTGEVAGYFQVVIGVGINLKMPISLMDAVEQPWSSLELHGFKPEFRNNLAGELITRIMGTLGQFTQDGFSSFNQELAKYDVVRGREIMLTSQASTVQGTGAGIGDDGSLRILTPDGILNFRSGQVSLRLRN